MRLGHFLLAVPLLVFSAARSLALDLSDTVTITGYADARLIAPADQNGWLYGGMGKFRFGSGRGNLRFVEAYLQADVALQDDLHFVGVLRAEPLQRTGIDAMEAYLSWQPKAEGDLSWSVKTGAFYPTISLENDDLGWASSYTLTYSAINSWIGEELRTIGSEAIVKWRTDLGTFSVMGSLYCCNDPTGILLADRGWAMHDRPIGLIERLRIPDVTGRLFRRAVPWTTSEFEEIDGRVGWYAGLVWQLPGIVKITATRYDNAADAAARTLLDTSWATHFWNVGARTGWGPLVLISQWMTGDTLVIPRPGMRTITYYDSAFLLASYDLDDVRFSIRGDWFETRRPPVANVLEEDGHAVTLAVSWSPLEWMRLTGEWVGMDSRKGAYVLDGMPSANMTANQFQLSTQIFF
jgi:hypothetical protein